MGAIISKYTQYDFDVVVSGKEFIDPGEKKTGIDGVKAIFQHDKFGCPSPQVCMIGNVVSMATIGGAILGGTLHGSEALATFIRTNQATAFESPHMARRSAYDRTILGFARGSFAWGWRIGVFSSGFILLTTLIPAYRGEHSVFDFVGSTALTGMIYKFKQGPKPMIAGGIMGAMLGTLSGCVIHGTLAVVGLTIEDIYDYKSRQSRQALEEVIKAAQEK